MDSSLLFQGRSPSTSNYVWMHPIVAAATAARQQPQLKGLVRGGKQQEALGLLAWYGAREANYSQTAAGPSQQQPVCEAATAAVLPKPGQRDLLNLLREPACSSSLLAVLWQQFPRQASLLLHNLAKGDATAISVVSYSLLRPDGDPAHPIRQGVCIISLSSCTTMHCVVYM